MRHQLLPCPSYWYLATPYSHYRRGIDAAFTEACRIAGKFVIAGIPAFSPIAHSHSVARASDIDPLDHTLWLDADEPMMAAAHGLIVVCMDGWDDSMGIAIEINAFREMEKPIWFLDPATMALT